MSPNEIEVGKTYVNRGAGHTLRTVIAIKPDDGTCAWFGQRRRPVMPVVVYRDKAGHIGTLFLCSFAQWTNREAKCRTQNSTV